MAEVGPTFAGIAEYGARLGDAGFWEPHVRLALAQHGLEVDDVVAGTVGSFPTFLTGRHVVKLFGDVLSGGACYRAELAVHQALRSRPAVPTPTLVAHGHLFDRGWPWPYLITTRLGGRPWSDEPPSGEAGEKVAHQLGEAVRALHDTPPPADGVRGADVLARLHRDCAARQAVWGRLPPHLVRQVEAYVLPPGPRRCLVHADIHGDHVFVAGDRLVGVIDWGDAVIGDPYYELPALHLGTFRGDRHLLRAFLAGYGWPVDADFARHAMSMTLLHEFDVLVDVAPTPALAQAASLDALANLLWRID